MKKDIVVKKVKMYGDAVGTFRSPQSNKLKYNVVTLDFDARYIQAKTNRSKEEEGEILFFCWDTDSYRKLKYKRIVSVVPLSTLLY